VKACLFPVDNGSVWTYLPGSRESTGERPKSTGLEASWESLRIIYIGAVERLRYNKWRRNLEKDGNSDCTQFTEIDWSYACVMKNWRNDEITGIHYFWFENGQWFYRFGTAMVEAEEFNIVRGFETEEKFYSL
jgi:hypothetical protein